MRNRCGFSAKPALIGAGWGVIGDVVTGGDRHYLHGDRATQRTLGDESAPVGTLGETPPTMSMIGTSVVRVEDPALLTVGGMYVDDVGPSDALHAVFVRSSMAHAQITEIDISEAEAAPGIVGVFTAAALSLQARPPSMPMFNQAMCRTWLANDRVRYVGEPVAVVVAETPAAGVDAAELVAVHLEPLEVVIDPRRACDNEVILFADANTNVVFELGSAVQGQQDHDDLFEDCDVVANLSMVNHRMAVAPIEPRAAVAQWADDDGTQRLTQWSCTQFPHRTRDELAEAMGVEPHQVRVITPDVGGGFGGKNGAYAEDMVVARVARHLGRAVRWTETRTENMVGQSHARSLRYDATIGGTADGRIIAYRLDVIQDAGAYPNIGAALPIFTRLMAPGVYAIDAVAFSSVSVVTNTTPVGAYRGAGRPEATSVIERIIDVFAAEVGLDPVEVRRRNVIAADAFPVVSVTGADMDSGDYIAAIDAVMEAANYDELRAEQQRRRADPEARLLGLGWCTYCEITNPIGGSEFAQVVLRPDGSVLVLTGSSSHGQGHHTTFAQLASEVTGMAIDQIEVRHGDTDEVARGSGTGGSRSLQVGGSAVHRACEDLVVQAREVIADMLEADPADIVLVADSGTFSVAGSPAITRTWADLAAHIVATSADPLQAIDDFSPPAATFPFGAHLSVVEVDRQTGEVTILRHLACDDAGTIVNPAIVDGQVHGGVVAGIAHTFLESVEYDDYGNPLTTNFMDYAIPSAAELPNIERIEMQTPTDRNPLGAKGIGEAGTIGAGPAVHNAVVDAVSHLGIRHIDMPLGPRRIWQAMRNAEA